MLTLVLAALRARRAQAFILFVLAAFAGAAAAAAPGYALAATRSVATAEILAATPAERTLSVRKDLPLEGAVDDLAAALRERLDLPAFTDIGGAHLDGQARTPAGDTSSRIAYRADLCAHVLLDGACPAGAGEAVTSTRTAARLGLRVGDRLDYTSTAVAAPFQLRIVGVYRPREPYEPYWGRGLLAVARAGETGEGAHAADDAIFVSERGLAALRASRVTATLDRVATGAAFVATDPAGLPDRVARVQYEMHLDGYELETELPALAQRVERDQRLVYVGVPVAAAQLLLLCWLALFVAVQNTARDRRPDVGLLKLRGSGWLRTFALVAGQSAVPMLAGAVLGHAAGYAAARAVDGEVARLTYPLALAATALAVLGALVAGLMAERRTLHARVTDLMRRVPARRARWTADVVDLVVVAAALAGLYQVRSASAGGLALLAPGLLAVAVALLATRLLMPVAAAIGHRALTAGRLGTGLTGVYLARRPGLHRVAALLAVAVALLGTALLGWGGADRAAGDRAAQELGADRVLTVQAHSRAHLLAAVRAADPAGHGAMAVVQASANTAGRGALLVDTTRLAAVARWRPEYGSAGAVAALLRPPAPPPIVARGDGLRLDLTRRAAPSAGTPVAVLASLAGPRGDEVTALFGPLAPGRRTYAAATPGCAAGCRLVSFTLLEPVADAALRRPAGAGAAVTLHRLDQSGPDAAVLDEAGFTDRTRWRPGIDPTGAGLVIATDPAGLALTVADSVPPPLRRDTRVYVLDAPLPLPALTAGDLRPPALVGDDRITAFAGAPIPVQVGGHTQLLPRLGREGVLLDLEYADRAGADFGGGDVLQVWLTSAAPQRFADRLAAEGVQTVAAESVTGLAERYRQQGTPVALRFQLLVSAGGVLLAAGTVGIVAAVERRPRAAEFAALRAQGASAAVVRSAARGGYAVLVTVSTVVGLVAVVLARFLATAPLPVFVDGWRLLPTHGLPRPLPLAVAAVATAAVLAATASLAAAMLVRRIRQVS